MKKWPIGHINSFGNNNHKNKHYRVTHKINGHCSGHIPQLRDFFKRMSTYGFARNWIVFVFVCFYSKIKYKNRVYFKIFFFSKYSRWIFQCDSTLPLKTMTLTTLINTIWGRLISHALQLFFLPIVFRGIKQNIIYIYPYENSNSSRAPSNIHRTWLSQIVNPSFLTMLPHKFHFFYPIGFFKPFFKISI